MLRFLYHEDGWAASDGRTNSDGVEGVTGSSNTRQPPKRLRCSQGLTMFTGTRAETREDDSEGRAVLGIRVKHEYLGGLASEWKDAGCFYCSFGG
jgi:hypothetical protein